eukprot:TRINITY_DN1529_c0_g1_i7.p1 TRINITY_DN1529_c0_g1~~TRINITY_DN1529_c0_g1_i7.p1  ORF type:complete len:622 (-),score=118.87 TRINITY_DN1529_c0_g1_i7:161-1912(-)
MMQLYMIFAALASAGRHQDQSVWKPDFAGCSSQQLLSVHAQLNIGTTSHAGAEGTLIHRAGSDDLSEGFSVCAGQNVSYFQKGMLEVANQSSSNLPAATPHRPDLLTVDLQRTQTSVDVVDDVIYYKSAYFGSLSVGTPAQNLTVVFDTGSGNLILPSTYCHSTSCKVHKRFRRSASSTAHDVDGNGRVVRPDDARDQLTISFGTGEVTGVFVEDNVCFGADAHSQSCVSMKFVAATEMSEDPFKDFTFDGVLGLGLPTLSHASGFSFLESVSVLTKEKGSAYAKTFALFLASHEEETSKITFGGWDEQHLDDNEVRWNPVVEPEFGHWMLEIKSLRVDGQVLSFCEKGCKAVVDSGTSLLGVPSDIFPELYELLNHAASLEGECHSQSPHLEIELDGLTMTLDGEDFAHLEEHQSANVTQEWGSQRTNSQDQTRDDMTCSPMLMTIDLPEPIGPKLFILGEPVLRKYYTIYDAERQRIGLGLAQHAPKQARILGYESEEAWFDEAEKEAMLEEQKVVQKNQRIENGTAPDTEVEKKTVVNNKAKNSRLPFLAIAALLGLLLAASSYNGRPAAPTLDNKPCWI